ncbi:glycosyltransferase [Paraflavisolibacter sp. H34]|uniref:XrtY-associated glycosyltransferase XYAG1 n=1 Tax=Huijunlia imazamoxiresistens TaxID=3127457 RepID=UPI003015D939
MKILFVTPSYKPAYIYGGPTISVSQLAEALVGIGYSVTVYTTTANGTAELDVPVAAPTGINGVAVHYFKRVTGDPTHISPALWRQLWKTHHQYDIIHLQSWWNLLILGSALLCKWSGRKYIVSPRGMLGAYSFQHQHGFPKKVLHAVLGKRLLKSSVLHATTRLEWNDCMQVYDRWQGFIEHNLVPLPPAQDEPVPPGEPAEFTIGFLSRVDPKKGMELLLRALATVSFPYRLCIAGTGTPTYMDSLKALAAELEISDRIEWCGWKAGAEKLRFLKRISLFALPSYNENFAIAVTEALAMGTPVLVSENVGLADYVLEKGLGWVCRSDVNSIACKLTEIFHSREERLRVRQIAPRRITEDFNKERLAARYATAYHHLLTGPPG